MTSFRRTTQQIASAVALLGLVLRLLLPLLHSGHAHTPRGDLGGTSAANACACAAPVSTAPWWQATDGSQDGERQGDDDHIVAAPAPAFCLACHEAHLPPAPPPSPTTLAPLAAATTPTAATPRAPPRCAPERSQHHSRAPPHAPA